MDEIDQFGHVGSHESKKYSQKILGLSELVPGKQIDITISKLENEIQLKQVERDRKIKNLKTAKKKKAEKKSTDQRIYDLSGFDVSML